MLPQNFRRDKAHFYNNNNIDTIIIITKVKLNGGGEALSPAHRESQAHRLQPGARSPPVPFPTSPAPGGRAERTRQGLLLRQPNHPCAESGRGRPGRTCSTPPASRRLPQTRPEGRMRSASPSQPPAAAPEATPAAARPAGEPLPQPSPGGRSPSPTARPAEEPLPHGGRRGALAPYLSRGVCGRGSLVPPEPRRGSGQPALLLLGRAADQRRRYRNWLRLEAPPASGGREAGAGRSWGVRREPFIQEYPGLFLLLLAPPRPGEWEGV